jgi:predicted  nucleic acid-binding Zn ribbon protein
MYTIKANFELTEKVDSEQASELANGLLCAWRMNG